MTHVYTKHCFQHYLLCLLQNNWIYTWSSITLSLVLFCMTHISGIFWHPAITILLVLFLGTLSKILAAPEVPWNPKQHCSLLRPKTQMALDGHNSVKDCRVLKSIHYSQWTVYHGDARIVELGISIQSRVALWHYMSMILRPKLDSRYQFHNWEQGTCCQGMGINQLMN